MKQYFRKYIIVKKGILLFHGLFICLISLYGQAFNFELPVGKILEKTFTKYDYDSMMVDGFNAQALRYSYDTSHFEMNTAKEYFNKAIEVSKQSNYLNGEVITYNNLGWMFSGYGFQDSSKYYFKKAMAICEMRCDTASLLWCYYNFGTTFYNEHMGDSAYIMYTKAQELATEIDDKYAITTIATSLANVFLKNHDMMQSAKYCLENVRIAEMGNDTFAIVNAYKDLSELYSSNGLRDKQMELVSKIIGLTRRASKKYLFSMGNITAAKAFLEGEKYDSSLYYIRLNMSVIENKLKFNYVYKIAGDLFLKSNRIDSAKYYYALYNQYFLIKKMPLNTEVYLNMGHCELKTGDLQNALKYYRLAESRIKGRDIFLQQRIYKALYEYYDIKGEYLTAISYLKEYNALEDTIQRKRDAFKTGLISIVLESKKMEEQIGILKMEGQYQALLTSKQVHEKNMVFGSSIFVLCFITVGFIRFRKYNKLKSKQTLLNERLRISHELHDEVGATLSGIAMYSHVATEQLKAGGTTQVLYSLSFMQKSAGEMVNKLSDIVWLINPQQDTIMEIFGRLGEYGKQMARVRNMQIRIDLPSDLASKHIPPETRRNIYLFCKEAINNAVKYSRGKLLVLQVKSIGKQLIFSVTDDGNGFDESIIKKGNGLVSMQKRAEDIGAVFNIDTKIDRGTRLEMTYKIIH